MRRRRADPPEGRCAARLYHLAVDCTLPSLGDFILSLSDGSIKGKGVKLAVDDGQTVDSVRANGLRMTVTAKRRVGVGIDLRVSRATANAASASRAACWARREGAVDYDRSLPGRPAPHPRCPPRAGGCRASQGHGAAGDPAHGRAEPGPHGSGEPVSKANAGGSFGSRPRATLPSVKTIFALIALLLPAGGSVALADEPAAPAAPEAIVAYQRLGRVGRRTPRGSCAVPAGTSAATSTTPPGAPRSCSTSTTPRCRTTSASNAVGFDRSSADCADQTLPAIAQTRSLFRWAREKGVAVFFVTGRREAARQQTAANLRAAGYRGGWTLKMRPDEQPRRWRDGWKARVRRAIVQRRDFRILANLGDQWSDLDGGWSARRFKLPNPMYVIPTA